MVRIIEVVCGIIADDEGNVLVCQRGKSQHLGGLWEFPGGKIELGESPESALRRELMEELAIDVAVFECFPNIVEWADGEVAIRLTGFHCKILHGEPMASVHEEIQWCHHTELQALDWAEADLPFVEALQV